MKFARAFGILALALTLPMTAMADPKDDARRHFMAGLEAAKAEQFEVALQHFLAAQDAFPHPATLYNVARTYTDLGDYQNALTYYRLFRDLDPSRADEVDPVIEAIQLRLTQRTAPTTVTVGTPTVATTGGGSGPRQVIDSGPSLEEIARLQSIAAELQALSDTIETRAKNPAVMGGGEGSFDGEGGEMGGEGAPPVDTGPIPMLPGGGYAEGAYERLVVTASRYGQDPLDSPSTLTVLTSEDIRLSGVTNIPDLFRRVAGVEVMNPRVGKSEVSIRGFNSQLSNKILVLIDGRSTYLDFVGTTFWNGLPVTLEEIDRIEIIRGPGSAIYGANAMNGVVNIITKTPGEGGNIAKFEVGSPGYTRAVAGVSGRSGTTAYRFGADYSQNGRWEKEFEDGEFSGLETFTDNQDRGQQTFRANGRLDQTFLDGDGFASVSGGFSRQSFEYVNIGVLGPYGMEADQAFVRGDISYGPLHARAFYNHDSGFTGPWAQPAHTPYELNTHFKGTTFDVEVETSGEFDTGPVEHHINGGASYRKKTVADFWFLGQELGDDPYIQHHYAAFLQDEMSLGPAKLVASVRYDLHPLIDKDKTFSPRGTVILRVADKSSLRLNAGTAFRAPNMAESYTDFKLSTGRDGVYIQDDGSTDLSPERIVTAELGFHDESTLFHTADVALYYNRVTNFIFLRSVTPASAFYNEDEVGYLAGTSGWVNTAPVVNAFGAEAEAEFFPMDGLDIYVNGTFSRLIETENGVSEGDTSTSLVKANAGVMYRTPFDLDLSADAMFTSAQLWRQREFNDSGQLVVNSLPVPSRVYLNARAGFRPFANDGLEVAASVQNILGFVNPVIEHPIGHRVGGRAIGSISYNF
ncbi:MAG: TonB-dependent receptor [Proteobacteria bacterium]|nr:TonB-dependent receptor [Pseudomonadota bacterium]